MKTLFFLLFSLIFSTQIISQHRSIDVLKEINLPFDPDTKKITYKGVIETQNIAKERLYDQITNEITLLLKENNPKTLIDDRDQLKYAVQSAFEVRSKKRFLFFFNYHYYDVIYTLIIDFKDSKFKYTITDYGLFDKEEAETVYKARGLSSRTIKQYQVKTVPAETFFQTKDSRSKKRKIFADYQNKNAELIYNISQLGNKIMKNESEW